MDMLQMLSLKAKGYCCAQMMLILALEAQGKTNPDLVRTMSGLCFGIGNSGDVCGALSGGACLIALYAGKGCDEEAADIRYIPMMNELVDWFKSAAEGEYGGTRCDDILEKTPDRSICAQIVSETYAKCMDILTGQGINPAVGKKG
jgi:C_GCAxxG_C_C family probable redox protein